MICISFINDLHQVGQCNSNVTISGYRFANRIAEKDGVYFITFTRTNWLPLFKLCCQGRLLTIVPRQKDCILQ